MIKPRILRKRFIPDEVVDISRDELIYRDEELIITKWKTIRPRKDFSNGISFAFTKEGYKISKFYTEKGEFLYWYCDIIDAHYDASDDTYTLEDLLVDVKVLPDGTLIVMDVEEIADALEQSIITQAQAIDALRKLDKLLRLIYDKSFPPAICNKY